MAKKKTVFVRGKGEAFYPPENSVGYVYLKSLVNEEGEKGKETASWASSLVSSKAGQFGSEGTMDIALNSLGGLVGREREAENQFLSEQLGIDVQQIKNYDFKQLIDKFNTILNLESTYRTNIERIKMMSKEGSQGNIDRLYTVVNYELPDAIFKFIETYLGEDLDRLEGLMLGKYDGDLEDKAARFLTEKLKIIYAKDSSADEGYKEFAEMIRSISHTDPLIQNLLRNYGLTTEQLRQSVIEKRKEKKTVTAKNIYLQRRGGNAFEVMVQKVLDSISAEKNGIAINTGSLNNMKADHIMTFGISSPEEMLRDINGGIKIDDDSTRLKNIELLSQFFERIKKVNSSIVFISDKNYNLKTSSFAAMKGFAAETPTLANLGGVLSRAGVSNIDDLVFALANTGSGRFNVSAANMERFIATKIGNFLFDDIVITDTLDDYSSSMNRIHVFNLGGIYVPLSVFLESAYQALNSISGQYQEYINVKYHATSIPYAEQKDGLTRSDWVELYNHVISKSTIAIHFFGDFMQFIQKNL